MPGLVATLSLLLAMLAVRLFKGIESKPLGNKVAEVEIHPTAVAGWAFIFLPPFSVKGSSVIDFFGGVRVWLSFLSFLFCGLNPYTSR